MSNSPDLAELLLETGHHHHQAYIESDGADPDWALWYAGYIQARLWDSLGSLPSRSRLVHLLLSAEEAHLAEGDPELAWPPYYAKYMMERLT